MAFDISSPINRFPCLCWVVLSLPLPFFLVFLHIVTLSYLGTLGSLCPHRNPGDGDTSGSLKSVRFTPCCLRMAAGISCVSDMDANDSQPCRTGEDLADNPMCDEKLPEGKNGKKGHSLAVVELSRKGGWDHQLFLARQNL